MSIKLEKTIIIGDERGKCTKKVIDDVTFKQFKNKKIGENIQFEEMNLRITGGNCHDGTLMYKLHPFTGFKRIWYKNTKKRIHGSYIDDYIKVIHTKLDTVTN